MPFAHHGAIVSLTGALKDDEMDYKNTLNLPRTDFPMKADLVAREPQRQAKWEQENLYGQIQAARSGAPRFVLHDGPPFANGDVHVGTAFYAVRVMRATCNEGRCIRDGVD